MKLLLKYVKPTCQNYHERKFYGYNFNWKLIYKLPRIATYDAKIRISSISSLMMYYILIRNFFILV